MSRACSLGEKPEKTETAVRENLVIDAIDDTNRAIFVQNRCSRTGCSLSGIRRYDSVTLLPQMKRRHSNRD